MDDRRVREVLYGLLEELSALEHERWSHWQSYMHGKCSKQNDGSLIIPAELVSHWEDQIRTDYSDLTEEEKESDREQVKKYLPTIEEALTKRNF